MPQARMAPPETARLPQARITLQMIARSLSVSTATVSLALRESPLVAEQTKRKVQKMARDLGYTYNRGAAALRMARTNIIAVALTNILNPYYAEVLAAIEERALDGGHSLMFGTCEGDADRQMRLLTTFREYRPDGVLFSPTTATKVEHLDPLIASGIPVVQMVREVADSGLDFVGLDDVAAARLAVGHLLALGHRRIALLGGTTDSAQWRARQEGYLDGLQQAGASVDPSLMVQGPETRAGGISGMHWLLERRDLPTAVLCHSDLTALGAMVAMRQRGVEPGRDISIVGCDNIAEADTTFPGLTTICGNHVEMAHTAMAMLMQRMANPLAPQRRTMLPPRIIVRGTTSPRAA